MSIDPFTRRNPSYCLVDLENAQTVSLTTATLSRRLFKSRPRKVGPGVGKQLRAGNPQFSQPDSTRWKFTTRASSTFESYEELKTTNATPDVPAAMREHRRLHVGNRPKPIDNHMSDLEVSGFSKDFHVEAVSNFEWPVDPGVQDTGFYAFADMGSYEEARRAIAQLHGEVLLGRDLIVRLATSMLQYP